MLWYLDDLRIAIRSLTRHWVFSVVVILLLGLGAGVSIVMLSVAQAVLFRPLPVPRPEELIRVVQHLPRVGIMSSFAPRTILEPVQKVLASIHPSLAFREVHTLDAEVNASVANERLMAVVVSTFAICAAVAALAGIYGLMAYLAALRRREVAIRMALGATGLNIVRLMTRETLIVVLVGIVLGLAAARALAPVLQPMLFDTSATSPVTALVTATAVLVAAFMATAGPIGQVAETAPAQVLRE